MPDDARFLRQVPCMHVLSNGKDCGALHGEMCRDESGKYIKGVHPVRAARAKRTGMNKAWLGSGRLRRYRDEERERRKLQRRK